MQILLSVLQANFKGLLWVLNLEGSKKVNIKEVKSVHILDFQDLILV